MFDIVDTEKNFKLNAKFIPIIYIVNHKLGVSIDSYLELDETYKLGDY